jgi:3-methyladenine DNA glycosylase/8-oxoguanine DNA glycosylase
VPARTVTSIEPPRLVSLTAVRAQLERSSRSMVFAHDGDRLFRAWGPAEHPWVLAVEPRGARWRVEAWGAPAAEARASARALFSFDHPLEEFYRQVRTEPVLRGTERRFRGLRIARDPTVYEALLHAIIGQQLSVASANALQRRLYDRAATVLEVDGIEVPRVPTPSRLGALAESELRGLGLSRVKSSALRSLAAWTVQQGPCEETLAAANVDAAITTLDDLPGVGRWTAENALLRGAGRRDMFVAGDLGVRVALERFAGIPRSAPEARARAWAERHYPGWGSYATLYLWRRLVTESGSSAG